MRPDQKRTPGQNLPPCAEYSAVQPASPTGDAAQPSHSWSRRGCNALALGLPARRLPAAVYMAMTAGGAVLSRLQALYRDLTAGASWALASRQILLIEASRSSGIIVTTVNVVSGSTPTYPLVHR
jgi:hypothetical protein